MCVCVCVYPVVHDKVSRISEIVMDEMCLLIILLGGMGLCFFNVKANKTSKKIYCGILMKFCV